MSDMLADGLAFLTSELETYASQPAVYTRPSISASVNINVMLGSKLLKIDDGFGGIRIQWTDMDFLIPADNFFFTYGNMIIPHRGDTITITIAGHVQTFEVLPFGNEPPWRWSDPNQTMLRVHTKLIDIGGAYV